MRKRRESGGESPHDVIIVLGAHVRPEGTPSEALKRRLALALERYAKRPVPIICCGAQGKDEPMAEGDFMAGWLQEKGVPKGMLHPETASYDTMENLRNAAAIMKAHGYDKALIVTSDYHVRRSLWIARRYGIPATGAGSPSLRSYWLMNHGRELLAFVKFLLVRK